MPSDENLSPVDLLDRVRRRCPRVRFGPDVPVRRPVPLARGKGLAYQGDEPADELSILGIRSRELRDLERRSTRGEPLLVCVVSGATGERGRTEDIVARRVQVLQGQC